jgi:hypothetical protein
VKSLKELADELVKHALRHPSAFLCWHTVDQVADWLRAREEAEENPCPYDFSHTRHWCGYEGCRDA